MIRVMLISSYLLNKHDHNTARILTPCVKNANWKVLSCVGAFSQAGSCQDMDDHHIGYPLLWIAFFLQAVDAVLQYSKLIWIDQDKIIQINKHNTHANMYFKEYKHISTLLTMSRVCGHSAEQSFCYIVYNSALLNPCYFSWLIKGGYFLDFHWGQKLNLSESSQSAPEYPKLLIIPMVLIHLVCNELWFYAFCYIFIQAGGS